MVLAICSSLLRRNLAHHSDGGMTAQKMFRGLTGIRRCSVNVILFDIPQSIGRNELLSSIMKATISEICGPLSVVFNKSLSSGKIPDALKVAKIIPIHKADCKKQESNCRPIWDLPFLTKILERLMYSRLFNYLNSNNLLVENQYRHRDKQSTFIALLQLVDDISSELDKYIIW